MACRMSALVGITALMLATTAAHAANGLQTPAPPGAAPQALQLKADERTVLSMTEGAIPTVLSRGPADASAIRAPQTDDRVETLAIQPSQTNTAAPQTFVATLRNFGPKGLSLRVENGYDHPLIYDAVILRRRGDRITIERASICPIKAKGVSTEAWGEPLEGVAIFGVRTPPPGDLRCTGPNNLTTAAVAEDSNVCVGEQPGSPLSVRLFVDPATGAVRSAGAVWSLGDTASLSKGPIVFFEYPMQGEVIGGRPVSLQVAAFVASQPVPTAKTAAMVVSVDGRERARRPWGLYAQQRAQLNALPPGAKPVGFFGIVPFPRVDQQTATDDFAAFLAEVGAGRVRELEVQVVGDDGSVLGRRSYSMANAPTADPARVSAALALAKAAAASPGHCPKPPRRSGP